MTNELLLALDALVEVHGADGVLETLAQACRSSAAAASHLNAYRLRSAAVSLDRARAMLARVDACPGLPEGMACLVLEAKS